MAGKYLRNPRRIFKAPLLQTDKIFPAFAVNPQTPARHLSLLYAHYLQQGGGDAFARNCPVSADRDNATAVVAKTAGS
jgi:hypothetical protein